jgi:NADH:ubiquinone oxidoreductase subunit 4 (subunit M)
MPAEVEKHHVGDVTVLDKVAIATLCFCMIVIGMFPAVMVPMVETGAQHILDLLGG